MADKQRGTGQQKHLFASSHHSAVKGCWRLQLLGTAAAATPMTDARDASGTISTSSQQSWPNSEGLTHACNDPASLPSPAGPAPTTTALPLKPAGIMPVCSHCCTWRSNCCTCCVLCWSRAAGDVSVAAESADCGSLYRAMPAFACIAVCSVVSCLMVGTRVVLREMRAGRDGSFRGLESW
jgi:hypothetical protein